MLDKYPAVPGQGPDLSRITTELTARRERYRYAGVEVGCRGVVGIHNFIHWWGIVIPSYNISLRVPPLVPSYNISFRVPPLAALENSSWIRCSIIHLLVVSAIYRRRNALNIYERAIFLRAAIVYA